MSMAVSEWECWDCGLTFAADSPTCPKCKVELHVFEVEGCDCIQCCPNGHCECPSCDEPCPTDCLIDLGFIEENSAMKLDYWFSRFRPEPNLLTDGEAAFGGSMFETYGPELDYVLSVANTEPNRVWTLVDGDEVDAIVAGYHLVNRLGYFVTCEPFSDDPMFREVELTV